MSAPRLLDAASDDSSGKSELVSYAPASYAARKQEAGGVPHRLVTLVVVPQEVVFESILQEPDAARSGFCSIVGVSTVVIGILLARWFIGPLLRIIEVTRQLHEGHLYNRARIKRGDELGDMASQIDSTMEKFSEVISQIRDMVGSVSMASNELKSSSHQLSQGSHEQAATLQEIAGACNRSTRQSGATPSTRETLRGWRTKPAARPRKGVKRFARRWLRCERSPRRS